MSEEKKEESCCSSKGSEAKSGCGCGCGSGMKLIVALIVGAFIFAAGMWFAKAHCHMGGGNYCPMSGAPVAK